MDQQTCKLQLLETSTINPHLQEFILRHASEFQIVRYGVRLTGDIFIPSNVSENSKSLAVNLTHPSKITEFFLNLNVSISEFQIDRFAVKLTRPSEIADKFILNNGSEHSRSLALSI